MTGKLLLDMPMADYQALRALSGGGGHMLVEECRRDSGTTAVNPPASLKLRALRRWNRASSRGPGAARAGGAHRGGPG